MPGEANAMDRDAGSLGEMQEQLAIGSGEYRFPMTRTDAEISNVFPLVGEGKSADRSVDYSHFGDTIKHFLTLQSDGHIGQLQRLSYGLHQGWEYVGGIEGTREAFAQTGQDKIR